MKYQGIESSVDPENEKNAIVSFLDRYWDVRVEGDMQLQKVIDYIFDKGVRYGIAMREDQIEPEIRTHNALATHDTNRKKIEFMRTRRKSFSFEKEIGALEKRLKPYAQIDIKPKGYEEFCATHPEDFPKDDEKLEFEGTNLHYSLGSSCLSFAEALSRVHVKYDDQNQGRNPLTTMIGTIFRQGMNVGVLAVEQRYRTPLESAR